MCEHAKPIETPLQEAAGAPIQPGDVVANRYRVERILGSGAFGWVAAAVHTGDGTRAALKVLRPEQASSAASVARFVRRELQILRRVHERGPVKQVVRALEPDIIEERGLFFLVLELIEGPSLTEVLTTEKILDQAEARRLLHDCAVGLAAIHAAEGVHRDIKPDNVRLRPSGEAVLLDLGIAKALWSTERLTKTTDKPMTPVYAAPEQLAGEEVGPPADIYALGLIGYEMLTGAVPLSGRTLTELLANRMMRDAPDVRSFGRPVPDDMVVLLRACLDRRPAGRPAADAFARALGGDANATRTIVSASGASIPPSGPTPISASLILGQTAVAPPPQASPSNPLGTGDPPRPISQSVEASRAAAPPSRAIWWVLGALVLAGAAATIAALVYRSHTRTRAIASAVATTTASIAPTEAPSELASALQNSAKPAPVATAPTLHVELLETEIQVGKPIVARLEATAPLHVLLIDVYEGGDGAIFSPSNFKRDLAVAPGEGVWFPPDKFEGVASLPRGARETREAFHAFGFATVAEVQALVPKAAYTVRQLPLTKADVVRIEEAARKAGAIEATAEYLIRK